jgi:hypothetical protein
MCRNQVRGLVSETVANSFVSKASTAIDISGTKGLGVIATVVIEEPLETQEFVFDESIAILTHQDVYIKYTIDATDHVFFLNVDDEGTLENSEGVVVYPIDVADEDTAEDVAIAFASAINAAILAIGYSAVRSGTTVVVTSETGGSRESELTRHNDFPASFTRLLVGTDTPEITGSISLQVSLDNSIFVDYATATTITALASSANYMFNIVDCNFRFARVLLTMSAGYGGLSVKSQVIV